MSITPDFRQALMYLRSPEAIRERTGNVLARGLEGGLTYFSVDMGKLPAVAKKVAEVTKKNYPDLTKIPYHSRWNHFRAVGKVDLPTDSSDQVALVILSVLLDAGAGARWSYTDKESGKTLNRSEGLAIASLRMFQAGELKGNARFLQNFSEAALERGFQVSAQNPLVGVKGRVKLLRALGDAIAESPEHFGDSDELGGLFATIAKTENQKSISAVAILRAVLESLGPIWPSRLSLGGQNLGDVWIHPAAGGDGVTESLVPFHKLSQWLTYSLIEPFEWAGYNVTEIERLTGLAEYRNGGLLVDLGVLAPKDPDAYKKPHAGDSDFVIEWRALTVALLDALKEPVEVELGVKLPLAKILEGGTWNAGREVARERRPDGSAPFTIDTDGTLF
jgi:hypothetical protein